MPHIQIEEYTEPLIMLTDEVFNLVPELNLVNGQTHINYVKIDAPRVDVKIHIATPTDEEGNFHAVGSAWLDDKPFMVFRCDVRSGYHRNDRFIFDEKTFKEMIFYVRSHIPPEFSSLKTFRIDYDVITRQ